MPSPSKIKGSGFEREVAKFLSDTYGESFIRNNSGSGAYIGGANHIRKNTLSEAQIRHAKGDIIPPESFAKFNAEAKFYADFAFHQLLNTATLLEDWLSQLMIVADTDDINILFMKFNRKGRFVAVQAIHPWVTTNTSHVRYVSPKFGEWMIYSFENFFNLNSTLLKSLSK
jgi:hypothetical protein